MIASGVLFVMLAILICAEGGILSDTLSGKALSFARNIAKEEGLPLLSKNTIAGKYVTSFNKKDSEKDEEKSDSKKDEEKSDSKKDEEKSDSKKDQEKSDSKKDEEKSDSKKEEEKSE